MHWSFFQGLRHHFCSFYCYKMALGHPQVGLEVYIRDAGYFMALRFRGEQQGHYNIDVCSKVNICSVVVSQDKLY